MLFVFDWSFASHFLCHSLSMFFDIDDDDFMVSAVVSLLFVQFATEKNFYGQVERGTSLQQPHDLLQVCTARIPESGPAIPSAAGLTAHVQATKGPSNQSINGCKLMRGRGTLFNNFLHLALLSFNPACVSKICSLSCCTY